MHITRIYEDLNPFLESGQALVIFGPRQIGKTTLIENFIQKYQDKLGLKVRLETGDDIFAKNLFSSNDLQKLREYLQGYNLLVIDEAQLIPNIGQNIKLIIDKIKNIKIILSGSSSFELAGQIGEPLTGRKKTLQLFPISAIEILKTTNSYDFKRNISELLIYGSYPTVLTAQTKLEKRSKLEELTGSYLLKDILELERVKSSKVLLDVLRLLAFQIGSEVSLTEIGQKVGLDVKTVARYIDLFEKSFILFEIRGFSRNLRTEVNKKSKYYFYDLGTRNSLISSYNELDLRNDIGGLWENFLFIERLKRNVYSSQTANVFFWRTYDQKEIDYIEEKEGKLYGYEFKWTKDRVNPPKDWAKAYPEASFEIINQENFLEFIV